MAVDTKLKRFSATSLIVPGFTPAAVPDGAIGEADRGAVSWMYGGISFGAVVPVSDLVPGGRLDLSMGLNLIVWGNT
jgi:hypothetical protein